MNMLKNYLLLQKTAVVACGVVGAIAGLNLGLRMGLRFFGTGIR